MPRTIREVALRKFDSIDKDLEWTLKHIVWLVAKYQERHPEIATPLEECGKMIIQLQSMIQQIRSTV